jgi:nucleotide-binding universal stress UspA family protein
MIGFKQIVVPVDFSAQSKIAARYVASYARLFHTEIAMLHVEVLPTEPYVWEPQLEQLADLLDKFVADDLQGLNVRRHVAIRDPAQEIVRYARNGRRT